MDQCNFKPMFKYLCQYNKTSCYTKIIKHLDFKYMCDMCCKYNRMDILKYLLLETNINATYALESSCIYNNIVIWNWLIKKSNGKRLQDKTYIFVFKMCCENDYLDIFESLTSKNDSLLDVDEMFNICCINDSVKIAKYIMENYKVNIDKNYVDACYQNSINVVKLLFHDVKNVNYDNIFDHLCIYGYHELCKWLYEQTNYNMFDKGDFRFTIACERGYIEIVKMFIEQNNSVLDDINNIMLRITSSGNVKMFNYILNINSTMTNIDECLNIAINYDYVEIVKVIIKMKTFNNMSLIKKCCDDDSHEIFIYLMTLYTKELNINEIFEYACIKNRIFIINWIIDNLSIRNDTSSIRNDTSSILLKCQSQHDVVKILLSLNEKYITNSMILTCMTECIKNSNGTFQVFNELLKKYNDEIPDYLCLLCQINNRDEILKILDNK